MQPLVQVKDLKRRYGEFEAVRGITFSINRGEVVALLGINGAGKTTTLRMLTGYLAPTAGEIIIDGIRLSENPRELQTKIGYLPESPALYTDMTVFDFLKYMYRIRTARKADESESVENAMKVTDIAARKNDYIGALSAGFRKRVGLAQAIVHNPSVIILDEPIADLDPRQILEIRAQIDKLRESHAILISSHILSELSKTSDRYLFMHRGKIVAEKVRDDITSASALEELFMSVSSENESV